MTSNTHWPIYTGDSACITAERDGGITKGEWYCGHCAQGITGTDDATPCVPLCHACDKPTASGNGLNPRCPECDALPDVALYALMRKNGKL